MTLKIELRPFEGLTIGNMCRLTNGENRSIFAIDGTALVLRDAHILTPDDVHDDITRLYYLVQQLGLNKVEPTDLLKLFLHATSISPSLPHTALPELEALLASGRYYSALALLRKLM